MQCLTVKIASLTAGAKTEKRVAVLSETDFPKKTERGTLNCAEITGEIFGRRETSRFIMRRAVVSRRDLVEATTERCVTVVREERERERRWRRNRAQIFASVACRSRNRFNLQNSSSLNDECRLARRSSPMRDTVKLRCYTAWNS